MMDTKKKNWILHQLRRISLKWPPRCRALERTKKTFYITSKKGTQVKRVSWTCEMCGKADLKDKEKQLDHKLAVVDPVVGYIDLEVYADRLFCDDTGWQVICLECHETKSRQENGTRENSKDTYFNKRKKK